MEVIELILRYAIAPFAMVAWWLFKKQDMRLEMLEKRTNELEHLTSRVEVEIAYISRDIREIKDGINKLIER